MATEIVDLRKKLRNYRIENEVFQKIPCSKKENKQYKELVKSGVELPEGVYAYMIDGSPTDEFYIVHKEDLTEAETIEYLTYKQLELTRTIKNCVVFFTVLTAIGIVVSLFSMLVVYGAR